MNIVYLLYKFEGVVKRDKKLYFVDEVCFSKNKLKCEKTILKLKNINVGGGITRRLNGW